MIRSELRPGIFFQHSNKERPIIYISMAKSRENLFYLEAQHLNPKNPARIEILKHGIQSGMDNKEIYLCLDMDGRAWTTYGNSEVSRIPYDDKLYTEVIAFYDRKRKALLETFKFDPSDLKDKASGCPWCAAGIPPTARVGAQMVTIEVTNHHITSRRYARLLDTRRRQGAYPQQPRPFHVPLLRWAHHPQQLGALG